MRKVREAPMFTLFDVTIVHKNNTWSTNNANTQYSRSIVWQEITLRWVWIELAPRISSQSHTQAKWIGHGHATWAHTIVEVHNFSTHWIWMCNARKFDEFQYREFCSVGCVLLCCVWIGFAQLCNRWVDESEFFFATSGSRKEIIALLRFIVFVRVSPFLSILIQNVLVFFVFNSILLAFHWQSAAWNVRLHTSVL